MKDDFYTRAFGGIPAFNKTSPNEQKSNPTDTDNGAQAPNADGDTQEHNTQFSEGGTEPEISPEDRHTARRAFSRVGFSLSAFSLISYAVIFIAYAIIGLFFADSFEKITGSVWFSWVMNIVSMYIIAFPALYLVLRNMKKVERPKSKLSVLELFQLFLISEAVMLTGNIVGINLNSIIGALLGREVNNGVAELINDSPIWLIALVAVIIGPIVEELIFRKLIIDRLSVFGDLTAVIVSAVLFGLFHGNFYQFFYAAGLGVVLGYIYTKTRNIIYPTVIHMLINFMGSVVALPISDMLVELQSLAEVITAGGEVDLGRFAFIIAVVLLYAALEYGMAIAGIILLVKKIRSEELYISNTATVTLPKREVAKISIVNAGMITFLVISAIQIILNIFMA